MKIIYPKHAKELEEFKERYEFALERILTMKEELTDTNCTMASSYKEYFLKTADFVLYVDSIYNKICDGSYYTLSLEELQAINTKLYEDIMPASYENSYANPTYAVNTLGQDFGSLLCVLYTELRGNIIYSFQRRLFYLTAALELFIEIYNLMEDTTTKPESVKQAIYYYVFDYADVTVEDRTQAMLDPDQCFYTSIITSADLCDLRYLYFFGEYVSLNELKTADHLNAMSQEKITAMATTFTQGYKKGFELYRIPLDKKRTVNIRYALGFEPMIKTAIKQFEQMGLRPAFYGNAVSLIHKNRGMKSGVVSTSANRQYDYDHRMDDALILDKALLDRKLSMQKLAYETWKASASVFAGPACIETFGEVPFTPAVKKECPSYSAKQQKNKREYQANASLVTNEFIPGDEISFTIIAYPLPEIGENYNAIFDETVRINTLDVSLYYTIQTAIITALDKGNQVTITGRGDNHTNLRVALGPLADLTTQTNFENCLADVNIPLGEVFTSPKLEGTNGVLHVTQVYLNEIKYENLELTFKDGCISDYTCSNFEDESENRKIIEQNLLNQHESLPMGEFAIGTNTTAYAMGKKFGISHLLPILIAEKTGPHFAIGDTCFSREEDLVTYNPDGKQMMAKENTYSLLRNTQPEKAYFNCHTDITIPYSELGDIIIEEADGNQTMLIHNGRFVLSGTEELNEPLDK